MAPDSRRQITIYGKLHHISLQRAKAAAESLFQKAKDVFNEPKIVGMLEMDWHQFLDETKRLKRGQTWGFKDSTLVFIGDEPFGSEQYFIEWAYREYDFEDFRPLPLQHVLAKEDYKKYFITSGHEFVYFDISIEEAPIGRLLIELYSDMCPKTCANFKELCIGSKKEESRHSPPLELKYKTSIFHRIVQNGWIQGGDFEAGKGTEGESIYGPTFEDENYAVPHNRRGVVGMANKGRHTNGSQFYITLQPAAWMDTKYVAFGQVIEGTEVLNILESQDTYNERPNKTCRIEECGVFDLSKNIPYPDD